jgi:hypothetical protein
MPPPLVPPPTTLFAEPLIFTSPPVAVPPVGLAPRVPPVQVTVVASGKVTMVVAPLYPSTVLFVSLLGTATVTVCPALRRLVFSA